MRYIWGLLGFFFVTVPSLIYGLTPYILLPIGLLVSLLTGSTSRIRAAMIADKIAPFFLIFGLPAILYFYVSKPLGIGISGWMIVYFLIRIRTGAARRDAYRMTQSFKAAKVLEDFEKAAKTGHSAKAAKVLEDFEKGDNKS